ncbi:MAG: polysaccharide biosynthesis C-terminal domain-containing protein [Fusicatenibacter sp.]|nr:polysaccharide biosynthesis C-terminal domain-containing protein [Lachnospiraceae bacterium]MDY2936706.1 polysaccharide biosynthesis C-terminal domain-containing protein [Fusicatenibacter sp.]
MGRGKELVKNTAIVAVGKVCTKFLSFFLLPFYTAVLSTEEYGIVDLLNTYISLLLPIIAFQIEDALFRFLVDVRQREEEKRKVISTVTLFAAFQSVLFIIIFTVIRQFVSIQYGNYLMMNVVVSIFSGAMLQLARGVGDNYTYAFGSFLTALVAILMNIGLVLFLRMGAEGLLITSFVSNLIGVSYIVIKDKVYRLVRIRWFDRGYLKEMLSYSLPLVPNYLSWWVVGASDKSIVRYFLGISQNGILSVSQKFSTAYTSFYSIFNLTWTESAAVHRGDEDRESFYSQIIDMAFRVLSCVCMGIIAVVALVFPYMIHENYAESYYQIPIYMISSLLYSVIGIYSVVYVAYKKTDKIAKTSLIAAIINVAVNVCLIRYIGLYAASISSAVAYGVMLVLRYFDIQKLVHVRMKRSVLITVILCMAINIATYYLRITWLSVLNLVWIVFYSILMNRKILNELLHAVKSKIGK